MQKRKLFHIIANPIAGKKSSQKNLQIVQDTFLENGVAFETHYTHYKGEAKEIVRGLTEQGETEIVALGGDGTLHEVLNGLSNPTACNLGLIPSGTGNDFAEHIGLPLDAKQAAQIILKGETKETDYLDVSGLRCMNVTGFGIDVDVLERCQRGKLRGKIKYLMSLVQSMFTFKGIKVDVESEGVQEEHNVLIAAACNGTQFGGGIKICPVAESADGKMNAVLVDFIDGKIKIIKAFIQLMKGKILEYSTAKHFLCDSLKITPKVPCPIQLDGEIYKDIPFIVKIKRGLRFYR